MDLVAEVAVENALFYFDKRFSYRVPQELREQVRRGVPRVLVPFGRGNRKVPGLVFSVEESQPERPLKPVVAVIGREAVSSTRKGSVFWNTWRTPLFAATMTP